MNAPQVNEVLEYDVPAVSRNLSNRKARWPQWISNMFSHYLRWAKDTQEQNPFLCSECRSKLEQVWMTHLLDLVDLDSFQPLSEVPPLGFRVLSLAVRFPF